MRIGLVVLLLFALVAPSFGAPGAGEQALHVASFNVWGIPGISDRWKERLAKLPDALRPLKLDVICLQELWLRSDQKQLASTLADTHPHAAHGAGGLMVLSRWPIRSEQFVAYPRYPELSLAERIAAKGLLDVLVQSPVGDVRFVNTHLTYAPGDNTARTKQLGVLLTYLTKHDKQPLFVVGDFNTPTLNARQALHPQYARVLKSGLHNANPAKKAEDGSGFVEPPNTRVPWPRKRTGFTGWDPDHIFFRTSDSLAIDRRSFSLHFDGIKDALSDHILVRATFLLKQVKQVKPTTSGR